MTPACLTTAEFVAILEDIKKVVAERDSFEGTLTYTFPEEDDPDDTFRVEARYRIGNSMGQGGMVVVGEFGEEGPSETNLQGN